MVKLYEVGGCVRDSLLGVDSKDVDFVAEARSFGALVSHLRDAGFRIFLEKPEFVTVRAGVPEGHSLRSRTRDADFVLARRDGPYKDGRRPEFVEPGSLLDDLARRDFTVNAMARDLDGSLIDPFGGAADLNKKLLRFVGRPMDRVDEDGLRVVRGLRFMVTKRLTPEPDTAAALLSPQAAEKLASVAVERVREEVEKMLAFDTLKSLECLSLLPTWTRNAIFRDGLRLSATLRR